MSGAMMMTEKEKKRSTDPKHDINRSVKLENRTGIPTPLKERMELSTGLSFDDVRVHYNSGLPARLGALAYTKGTQVEIGPGQERHLPHELGHVVQQKLGIVRANAMHPSGVALNTDPGLEHQADEIGTGKKVEIVQRRGDNVVQMGKTQTSQGGAVIIEQIREYLGSVRAVFEDVGRIKESLSKIIRVLTKYSQAESEMALENLHDEIESENLKKAFDSIYVIKDTVLSNLVRVEGQIAAMPNYIQKKMLELGITDRSLEIKGTVIKNLILAKCRIPVYAGYIASIDMLNSAPIRRILNKETFATEDISDLQSIVEDCHSTLVVITGIDQWSKEIIDFINGAIEGFQKALAPPTRLAQQPLPSLLAPPAPPDPPDPPVPPVQLPPLTRLDPSSNKVQRNMMNKDFGPVRTGISNLPALIKKKYT